MHYRKFKVEIEILSFFRVQLNGDCELPLELNALNGFCAGCSKFSDNFRENRLINSYSTDGVITKLPRRIKFSSTGINTVFHGQVMKISLKLVECSARPANTRVHGYMNIRRTIMN